MSKENDSLIRGCAKLQRAVGKHMGDNTDYSGLLFDITEDEIIIIGPNPKCNIHRIPKPRVNLQKEDEFGFWIGIKETTNAICEYLSKSISNLEDVF